MPDFLLRLRPKGWALRLVLLVCALGLLLGIAALADPYDCRIREGVSIGGLDVGNMTLWQAREAIAAAGEAGPLTQPLEVALPEETLILTPEALQLELSPLRGAWKSYFSGRLGSPAAPLGLLSCLDYNQDALLAPFLAYRDAYDTALTQPTARLSGDAPALGTLEYDPSLPGQTLLVTTGLPERHLDVEAMAEMVTAFYDSSLSPQAFRLTAQVPAQALPSEVDLAALAEQFCAEPVNDSLDLENFCPIPGTYGYGFDLTAARSLLSAAGEGETIRLPMEAIPPEIMGEAVYFQDLLGWCDTPHTNNEKRNVNLALVCQILDGYVIQPGEEFSFNGVVGERTAERGFQAAPAYSGNRLILDLGGGVCQTSTTLYNCALLADLEITDRVCHGVMVSYVPIGLDAAVNWATKTDMAFRNNTHFPIMLKAEVSDGYVRMKILGVDEKDCYIKMESTRGEDDRAIYSASYKCKYSKENDELLSRDLEARSTYYKKLG